MRKRLESTDLAKNHWRANPSMTPSQIRDLFKIPMARIYRIRNELVKDRLLKIKKPRNKAKIKSFIFNTQNREYVLHQPAAPVVIPVVGEAATANDYQIGGNHYKEMGVQPWDVIESTLSKEEFIGFLKGNIIKYSMRQGVRGEIDSNKCRHYIVKLDEMCKQWNLN
jgi:hypothetical protein